MALDVRLAAAIAPNGDIIKQRTGLGGVFTGVRSNGADLFITAWATITGETAGTPDVDLCALGEQPDGQIYGPSNAALDLSKDSDSPYADNTFLDMYEPLKGEILYTTVKTNSAITYGKRLQADGGFVVQYGYVDADSIATNTLAGVVGKALKGSTATADTEKIIPYKYGEN